MHYGTLGTYSKNARVKVSFVVQCTKMQLISLQNFNMQTYTSQLLWFFSLKCWFKCHRSRISRIHLSLPNAYKLTCFDRNVNGNRHVKFLECDYLLVQWCVKLTVVIIWMTLSARKCYVSHQLEAAFKNKLTFADVSVQPIKWSL